MKIGIISDVHANIYGLQSVLKRLADAELILCAGDITGYYPFVNEVFDELKSYNVIFVKGNHEHYILNGQIKDLGPIINRSIQYTRSHISNSNLEKLRDIPTEYNIVADGFKIIVHHGSPWDSLNEYIYPDHKHFDRFDDISADIIVLGHTHFPMLKKIGNKLIINPGSCGQPRDNDSRASYAILDTRLKFAEIFRVEYNTSEITQKIEMMGFDASLSEILKVGLKKNRSIRENKVLFG